MIVRLGFVAVLVGILLGCSEAPPATISAPILTPILTPTPAGDRAAKVNFVVEGRVDSVEDGDTLRIQLATGNRATIRFSDIDTPETSHGPDRLGQPGGQTARNSLLQLVAVGDQVRTECYERDQYERSVCHVFRGPTNLNLEQIRRGWGWLPENAAWVRDPASRPAEQQARAARLGAWGLPSQVSPDHWRRACWQDRHCPGAEP